MPDRYFNIAATVTPTNDAYTANDVIGGLITVSLIDAGATIAGGILSAITLIDDDNEGAELQLWCFDSAPTTIADDAAFEPTAADLLKVFYLTTFAAAEYTTINSLKIAQETGINLTFKTDGGGNFYFYVVCTGTPTYAATKTLKFRFGIVTQ